MFIRLTSLDVILTSLSSALQFISSSYTLQFPTHTRSLAQTASGPEWSRTDASSRMRPTTLANHLYASLASLIFLARSHAVSLFISHSINQITSDPTWCCGFLVLYFSWLLHLVYIWMVSNVLSFLGKCAFVCLPTIGRLECRFGS